MEQAPTQPNTTTKKTVLPDTAPKKPDPAPKEDAVRAFSHPPVDRMAPGPICALVRRGGRAVECTGLENRQGCEPFVGSNPTLSAISLKKIKISCLCGCRNFLYPICTHTSNAFFIAPGFLCPNCNTRYLVIKRSYLHIRRYWR